MHMSVALRYEEEAGGGRGKGKKRRRRRVAGRRRGTIKEESIRSNGGKEKKEKKRKRKGKEKEKKKKKKEGERRRCGTNCRQICFALFCAFGDGHGTKTQRLRKRRDRREGAWGLACLVGDSKENAEAEGGQE